MLCYCSDRACANAAATGLQTYDETAWRVQPAPGNDEIIWGNLAMRYKQRYLRMVAMWAVFIAILIFYLPVTAAIQAVVNLDNARKVPGLGKVADIPFITQILQGILPGKQTRSVGRRFLKGHSFSAAAHRYERFALLANAVLLVSCKSGIASGFCHCNIILQSLCRL